MKISLRDLETARANPTAYGQQLASSSYPGIMSRSYYMDWRDAVLRWHTSGNSPLVIRSGLENTLEARFKNQQRIAETLDRFDTYVEHYSGSGLRNQRVRMDVVVPITLGLSDRFVVSGEVTRLDRAGYRYVACLIASKEAEWKTELRMPLIQDAVAKKLNLDDDEVSVAVYCFGEGTYDEFAYSDAEIQAAYGELAQILQAIGEATSS
jgi:hypothetical protein